MLFVYLPKNAIVKKNDEKKNESGHFEIRKSEERLFKSCGRKNRAFLEIRKEKDGG